jgi:hypothetical protein
VDVDEAAEVGHGVLSNASIDHTAPSACWRRHCSLPRQSHTAILPPPRLDTNEHSTTRPLSLLTSPLKDALLRLDAHASADRIRIPIRRSTVCIPSIENEGNQRQHIQ